MKLSAEDIAIGKSSPVHVEVSSNEKPEHHKTNGHGIALVPQPSDDPLDPLVTSVHVLYSISYRANIWRMRIGPGPRNSAPSLLFLAPVSHPRCQLLQIPRDLNLKLSCTTNH